MKPNSKLVILVLILWVTAVLIDWFSTIIGLNIRSPRLLLSNILFMILGFLIGKHDFNKLSKKKQNA